MRCEPCPRPLQLALAPTLLAVSLLAACSPDLPPGATPTSPDATSSSRASSSADPLAQRAAHTMTTLDDGSLLVAGGCVIDGCTNATASTAVLAVGGTRPAQPMRDARDAHTATRLLDGSVLVVGGFGGEGRPPRASAEVYDPATGQWRVVGGLATARGGHAAALLGDGRVVVAGGWVRSRTYTASTEIYDPATERFGPGPDLPAAVDGLAATSLGDGSVLVVGGQREPGVASAAAARIRPDGTLLPVGALQRGRFKHALVTLPSGEAIALGGTSDDTVLLDTTEVFDPATGQFSPGPHLVAGRYKLSDGATVLPDGRIAIAGGGPGVELVDVSRGRSVALAGAGTRRSSFSTVGVLAAELVVLGGYDERIALTGTDLRLPLAGLPEPRLSG